jgi:hypothetical protein
MTLKSLHALSKNAKSEGENGQTAAEEFKYLVQEAQNEEDDDGSSFDKNEMIEYEEQLRFRAMQKDQEKQEFYVHVKN